MPKALRAPLLRIPGGRFRLAPWLLNFFPAHETYVEPFAGAASVLALKARAPVEILNDLDEQLINLFRVLQQPDQAAELRRRIAMTPFGRQALAEALDTPGAGVEAAANLVIRSWLGQGADAAVRVNGRPAFRDSVAARALSDWASFPDALTQIAERLRGVLIEHQDAEPLIRRVSDVDTLIFADPPHPLDRDGSREPTAHVHRCEVTVDDHKRFADALLRSNGPVVFLAQRDPLFDHLYRGWHRHDFDRLDDGERRTASVWLNPRCARSLSSGPQPGRGLFAGFGCA